MKYVAIYTHILDAKDDCGEWILNLICGTKDGHGCNIMSGEFIPYNTVDIPTVIKKDVCSYEWEEEVIPFNTLEEVFEDMRKNMQ